MKFEDIRTAVIGVGSMGQNHARVLNEISNLVGVVDLDKEQGQKIAKSNNTQYYQDYREIVGSVDAVCICVPTKYHKKVSEVFYTSGVHILVEKPLSDSLANAKYIRDGAAKSNVILSVGHIERFNPVVTEAKNQILKNSWGCIISLNSTRVSNFPARISDVGVLFDLSVHDIDISSYLIDSPVKSVYAAGLSVIGENEEHVNIILKHESGVISVFQTNWLTPMKIRKLAITSDKCYIDLDYIKQNIKVYSSQHKKLDESNLYNSKLEFIKKEVKIKKKEPLLSEIENFLSSVISKEQPLVDGNQGVYIVKVAEAAVKSIKENKTIYI
tara:strand:+ start:1703 stop:2686 length:984 start_codon:yes stop_codon:yes gene_type:complete